VPGTEQLSPAAVAKAEGTLPFGFGSGTVWSFVKLPVALSLAGQ
jgi:hypothetical protein